ncbi:MAG: hypothetical protein JJ975_12310 [Bacteroidia bacterium]|nr:hypothetical protein [Bacteroidia bacterium]
MRKKAVVLLASFMIAGGGISFGQSDTTTSMRYTIYGDYKPKLSSANKVITKPEVAPIKSTPPKFDYDLPNFAYSVLPTYHPAKAISIKSELDKPLTGNYFKLGAGNYLTPYAEFRVHSTRNKNFNYGAYGSHLSSNAGNPANADFSDNHLGVMGSKIGKKGELTGKLNYERHVVHFYGYDDSLEFDKRNINQIFNDFNGFAEYDRGYGSKKMGSKSKFSFYTFATHGNRRENDFEGSIKTLFKMPQKTQLAVNASLDYTNLIEDAQNILNRTFVRIEPSYSFMYKKIKVDAGLNTVVVIDSNGGGFKLFPNIGAEHYLVPKKVLAFARIDGEVKKNSLRQLSYLNPFVANDILLENTTNSFNVGGGLKGVLAKKIDYLLKVRFSVDNNLPLFLTDSTPTRQFSVVYDDVQTVAFQTGLGFRLDERFFIQFATTLYNYKTDIQAQAWQLPSFDADVNMRYTLAKKLNLRLQLYAYGERFQQDEFDASKPVKKLSPFMDINVSADYRYKKNISFFLNANNISNSRYQKWYAYPSFGLNLLAGITFSL